MRSSPSAHSPIPAVRRHATAGLGRLRPSALRSIATLGLLVGLTLGACARETVPDFPIDASRAPALLHADRTVHRGVPTDAADAEIAPFADQGAWFGFAVPPSDRPDLAGGFVGPYLMTSGRWVGAQLAQLTILRIAGLESAPSPTRVVADAPIGRLRSRWAVGPVTAEQTLWFDSDRIAHLATRLENRGDAAVTLELGWRGRVFPHRGLLSSTAEGIVLEAVDGTRLTLQPDRPTRSAKIVAWGYDAPLAEPIRLEPGGQTTLRLAISAQLAGQDAIAPREIHVRLLHQEASLAENTIRWNRYLAAVGADREPLDAGESAAVAGLAALVHHWRSPTGRLRHGALFESNHPDGRQLFGTTTGWIGAVALARFTPELAESQLRSLLDQLTEEGALPAAFALDAEEDDWSKSPPPIGAYATAAVHRELGDLELARALYPRLAAAHRHQSAGRSGVGANHSTIVQIDDSARSDPAGTAGGSSREAPLEPSAATAYFYREKRALAFLASAIGESEEAKRWNDAANRLEPTAASTPIPPAEAAMEDLELGRTIVQALAKSGSSREAAELRERLLARHGTGPLDARQAAHLLLLALDDTARLSASSSEPSFAP